MIVALYVLLSFKTVSKSLSPVQFAASSSLKVVFGPSTLLKRPVLKTMPL